jgi:Fe-S cluster assembly protein SufD
MSAAPALAGQTRAEALARLRAEGVPHRRVEAWKYSDLRAALKDGVGEIGDDSARWTVASPPSDLVEAVDLSKPGAPAWVTAHLGAGVSNTMSAASLAFARGGVALRVTGAVELPLALDFSAVGHVRALLVLEEGASITLLENASAAAWRNVGFEIILRKGAVLDHIRLSPATPDAVLVEEISLTLAAGAQYRAHFADFGAKLSRTELEIALTGEGAQAHLSGVAVLDGKRHADVTTHITHAVGNTNSTQIFKNVAGGAARAVYQGKVTVAQGADGSDSRQTAKALLLSENAEADLKPELEIFADDVKCAHGAAVGDLDADSLFYLRARGIPEAEARSLLIHAFLEDVLGAIAREDVRGGVREAVDAALANLA